MATAAGIMKRNGGSPLERNGGTTRWSTGGPHGTLYLALRDGQWWYSVYATVARTMNWYGYYDMRWAAVAR